ncbi:hypothetical protein E4T52_05924 [Aureobasidium sp. EXF-3400]|nr:hypothetical protein E4T51_03803 [Aureobasidium sp. EXF-12344]KAI4779164.1 hypothetical protein E4T52_05924 [Aureobasidium sp. EXF-3400]
MKFSALTFIALAASSVYGSVIDVVAHDAAETYVDLETRATCWKSDMQAIKDRINHYNVFCQAFNMRPNDASPLPTLTTAKLSGACACLLAQWNKQANPTSIASAPANTCAASDTNLIKKEAPKNFQSYCRWWNLASRSSSAIPGISVSQLTKSCKCLLTGSVGTASTAVKVTTSSTKTTAAATSTLACKKRRKVRRTVTVEVPAEATPSV